jgi:hypothetical protein
MGNPKVRLFFLVAVSLLMIFACTLPSPVDVNNIQPTQPITNTEPIIPIATTRLSIATPIVILETATATLMPTVTYTPTPSIPMVVVSVGTNCREGPGKVYNLLDGLRVGEQAEIVKLAPTGVDYVVIKRPHGSGECWLWLQHATITGNTSYLPIAAIPPRPTLTVAPITTSTATLAPPSPFAGDWTMGIFGKVYVVTLLQTGDSITGTFITVGGNTVNLAGTIAIDGKTVTGTFTETPGVSGTFTWYLLDNMAQFNGHGDIGGGPLEWCGYRAGQSAPVPCLAP